MRNEWATLTIVSILAACGGAPHDAAGDGADGGLPPEVTAALDLPETPYAYASVQLPAHFQTPFVQAMDNTPAENPITDEGATLGRVLFYDTTLSRSSTIACASCHDQGHGFSDPAQRSTGFEGGLTRRHAMPITDARFYRPGAFFWDERAATLEEQVLMPIQNEVEMGLTLDELVSRVAAAPYASHLFEQAFGDPTVTSERIARALAQFCRSVVSYRSRYDAGVIATGDVTLPFPDFTAEENRGKEVFLAPPPGAACAGCHLFNGPPGPRPPPNQAVFFIDIPTSNGLDATTDVADLGVGEITGAPEDQGRFKSPSLRNIAVTGPYMHDARFATLEEVVQHYRTGVEDHPNLDPRLRIPGGAPRLATLTDADVAALVAFLRTLTDEALLADPWFSDPFHR